MPGSTAAPCGPSASAGRALRPAPVVVNHAALPMAHTLVEIPDVDSCWRGLRPLTWPFRTLHGGVLWGVHLPFALLIAKYL